MNSRVFVRRVMVLRRDETRFMHVVLVKGDDVFVVMVFVVTSLRLLRLKLTDCTYTMRRPAELVAA